MVLTHDTAMSLRAAVALVNSGESPDTLTSVADVDAFYAAHGYTGRHDRTRAELAQLRELRPVLRGLLLAPRDAAAEQVNAILAQTRATPQLRRHDEQDWHLHLLVGEAPLAERIAAETAMAMVDVIRTDEHSRIAVCADDGCLGLALDLSRNRSPQVLLHHVREPARRCRLPSPPVRLTGVGRLRMQGADSGEKPAAAVRRNRHR